MHEAFQLLHRVLDEVDYLQYTRLHHVGMHMTVARNSEEVEVSMLKSSPEIILLPLRRKPFEDSFLYVDKVVERIFDTGGSCCFD